MQVSVTIDLSVVPQEKHVVAMRTAANSLTDGRDSVRVSCPPDASKKICAHFSVPDARQEDVVNRIGRRFWQVEDYQNSTIGFSRNEKRRTLKGVLLRSAPQRGGKWLQSKWRAEPANTPLVEQAPYGACVSRMGFGEEK